MAAIVLPLDQRSRLVTLARIIEAAEINETEKVKELDVTEEAAIRAYKRWLSRSNYLRSELGEHMDAYSSSESAEAYSPRLAELQKRLRDGFSGPISAAAGGAAGLVALITGFAPIWVAMPIGLLLGWVVADRLLAKLGK